MVKEYIGKREQQLKQALAITKARNFDPDNIGGQFSPLIISLQRSIKEEINKGNLEEIVISLIKRTEDPNITDDQGATALHLAIESIRNNNVGAITLRKLLGHPRINTLKHDARGKIAYQLAKKYKLNEQNVLLPLRSKGYNQQKQFSLIIIKELAKQDIPTDLAILIAQFTYKYATRSAQTPHQNPTLDGFGRSLFF